MDSGSPAYCGAARNLTRNIHTDNTMLEMIKDRSLRTIKWREKTMDAWYDPRDGVELTKLVYQGVDLIDIMTDSQIEEVEDILREWEQDYWTGS